jgi:RHS repeat-associated protein
MSALWQRISYLVCIVCIFLSPGISAQQTVPGQNFGYTRGVLTVSDVGAAHYSFSIETAPAPGGFQPRISITYNSQGGNGPLGIGWSIQGLSVISRTSNTMEQDFPNGVGFVWPRNSIENRVQFDRRDKYSLDGERLVLAYDSVPFRKSLLRYYGLPGTRYYTEQNKFSRVTLVDTINGSPTHFIVQSNDGLYYEYGNNANSKVSLISNQQPVQWLVNRIEDRFGNTINYSYYRDLQNGEYLPQKISYSGNVKLGKANTDSIVFQYEDVQYKRKTFQHGSLATVSKRLQKIICYAGSLVVRQYNFKYTSTSDWTSYLEEMQECGSTGCLLPTRFDWQEPFTQYQTNNASLLDVNLFKNPMGDKQFLSADFNGDGLTDVLVYNFVTGDNTIILTNTAQVNFTYITNPIPKDSAKNKLPELADFNGDQRVDLLLYDPNNGINQWYFSDFKTVSKPFIQKFSEKNSTFFSDLNNGELAPFLKGQKAKFTQDFTNDGLPDIFMYGTKNGFVDFDSTFMLINNGIYKSGSSPDSLGILALSGHKGWISKSGFLPGLVDSSMLMVADFDNNGLQDFFVYNPKSGKNCLVHQNTYMHYDPNWLAPDDYEEYLMNYWYKPNVVDSIELALPNRALQFTDINGDGLPDAIISDTINFRIKYYFNKGDYSFTTADSSNVLNNDYFLTHRFTLSDYNRDGLIDFVFYSKNSGTNFVPLNNAWNIAPTTQYSYPNEILQSNRVQLNGFFRDKGVNEYLVIDPVSGNNKFFLALSNSNSKLSFPAITSINEGFPYQKRSFIEYSNLLDTGIYRKTKHYSNYPNVQVQNAFQVVKNLGQQYALIGEPVTEFKVQYKYQAAYSNYTGRGFRGFSASTSTDANTRISTTNYYLRDSLLVSPSFDGMAFGIPVYIGDPLLKTVVSDQAGNTLSRSDFDLSYNLYPNSPLARCYHSYTSSNRSMNYELDGTLGNTTDTRQSLDNFGNVKYLVVDYGNGYIDSTVHTYINDTANWILGRLSTATLYKKAPGKPTLIRGSAFEYDTFTGSLLKEISNPDSDDKTKTVKTYQYDSWGNITKSEVTAWNGKEMETRATHTIYDASGKFIIRTIDALGAEATTEYEPSRGLVMKKTDINGLTTRFEYDEFGRMTKQVFPDSNWIKKDYKLFSANIAPDFPIQYAYAIYQQSSLNPPAVEFYDRNDRKIAYLSQGFDERKIYILYKYNSQGLLEKESTPAYLNETAQYSTYEYDYFGRHVKSTLPGNRTEEAVFEAGRRIMKNSAGQIKILYQNSKEQLVKVTDNNGKDILFDYDAGGNLVTVTDPKGNKIVHEYDFRGLKTMMTDPDLGTYSYEYNGFGELIKQTDPKGNIITLEYDKAGRLTKKTENEGATIWTYGNLNATRGKLIKVENTNSSVAYQYDALGRKKEEIYHVDNKPHSIKYGFDDKGRTTLITYPTGFAVKQVYNAQGHLSEIRRSSDNFLFWKVNNYAATGQLTSQVSGNNAILSEYFYNSQTQFVDSLRASNTSRFIVNISYTWDVLGNLNARNDNIIKKTEEFQYDNLNRLIESRIAGYDTVKLTYDELGNILSKSDVGIYEYGTINNGPHRVVKINTVKNVCIPSASVDVTYYSFNKTRTLSNDTARLEIYYDPFEQRNIQKLFERNVLVRTKIYIGGLFEIDTKGTNTRKIHYIRNGQGVIATYTQEDTHAHTEFWLKDHLGSLIAVTDSTGKILKQFSYDAWGKPRNADWTRMSDSTFVHSDVSRGFTGQEHYDLFALVDMNGRIYDPVIGRFLSADPFIQDLTNLQAYNRYSYVLNNPLSYTDPSGYFFGKIFKAVFSVFKVMVAPFVFVIEKSAKWIKENWRTLVVVAVAVGVSMLIPGSGSLLLTVLSGAAGGFAGNFTAAILSGEKFGDAIKSGLKGAAIGALSAGLSFGVGSAAQVAATEGSGALAYGVKVAGHGVVQGGISKLNGGKFIHGFYSGAISGGTAGYTSNMSPTGRVVSAAVIGGTTSEITGGKFANGAITGAYVMMFNEFNHMNDGSGTTNDSQRKPTVEGGAAGTFFSVSTDGDIGFSPEKLEMPKWGAGPDIGISYNPQSGQGTINVGVGVGMPWVANAAVGVQYTTGNAQPDIYFKVRLLSVEGKVIIPIVPPPDNRNDPYRFMKY